MNARLKQAIWLLLLAAAVIGIQVGLRAVEKEYCLTQLTMSVYYAIVVVGLCLLMGFAGQISLGHGAFFALGGYTSAVLTTSDFTRFQQYLGANWLKQVHFFVAKEDIFGNAVVNVSPWGAFAAAMLITFVVACLIGYPSLRLKGHYLAMATLGFGLIVYKIVLGSAFAGAADGINSVPEWNLVGPLVVTGKSGARVVNYYIACVVAIVLLLLLSNLVRSRVGRALQALHDGEIAAGAIGIDTPSYKLKVFVVSALLAAIAGVFLTHYTGGIGPSEASSLKSVRYVALAAAGGMANLWGGAVVSTAMNYFSLRGWFGSYDNAVFGALLIVIISIAPEGPFKPLGAAVRRVFKRTEAARDEHGAA